MITEVARISYTSRPCTNCNGLKRKPNHGQEPTSERYSSTNASKIMEMLRIAEVNMADSVKESNIADFLTNTALAVSSTHHTVLNASPGTALFGRDMMFDIPIRADWNKIGEYRQH